MSRSPAIANRGPVIGGHSLRPSPPVNPGVGGNFAGRRLHHPHDRVSVFFGAPLFAPWYFAPPPAYYYDYSAGYALSTPPPVHYEEMPSEAVPSEQSSYWYFCPSSQTYYPYVKECPEGWQQVLPQPAPTP